MEIRIANEKDFLKIMTCMLEVYDSLLNKEYYALGAFDIDALRRLYSNNGFVVIAEDNNEVVGYVNIDIDIKNETLLQISRLDNNNTAEVSHTGVLVSYRGHGLFSKMLTIAEEEIKKRNQDIKHIFATVHPDNKASLNTLLKNDYNIFKEVTIYGGTERYIVIKDL